MSIIKPMLAKDVNEDKLKFPLWMFPKIDGVFMLVQNGKAYARSLKHHENKHITELYSNPEFEGLRGELIAGDNPTAKGLVRMSSSAANTIEGTPETTFWCFDYVTPETVDLSYQDRFHKMLNLVEQLQNKYSFIRAVTGVLVPDHEGYSRTLSEFMEEGFEGAIIRDYTLPHKEGRSSSVKAHVWRWKPWKDAEIRVTSVTEGSKNNNEATTDELGRTKRSFQQDGLVPNGMVGNINGTLLADLLDSNNKVIMKKGDSLTISCGELTVPERKHYFENQDQIIGKVAKFRYFAFDLKDAPRYPICTTLRSEVDM